MAAVECGLIAEIGQSWGWDLHHPHNRRPQDVVALAQLSERVGLDLVTFQDHPYQPGYLDTWTLLSWVAAQTQTISVSGNVLNLPLRLPTVLARAVASLDLLSGGRVELGLGGGGFWDAIEAMGGPRRSPRETAEALSEATDVIRAIWDEQPGGVFFDGKHYRVHGAKRGPAPAHDISIWVGAYRPRTLRLVGTKGDGWLPSTSYLKPGDLERGNRIIDDAAQAAGRDPRKIRRLLNFSPADVDSGRLFEYGIENGVSACILSHPQNPAASDVPGPCSLLQRYSAAPRQYLRRTPTSHRTQESSAATVVEAAPNVIGHRLRLHKLLKTYFIDNQLTY